VRTTMTAVDVATTERVDVLVDLSPNDVVSVLEAALAAVLREAAAGLWLGPVRLDPLATLAEAGVRPGCLLGLGGPGPDLTRPASGAELHVVSGPDAGQVHPLPVGDTVIGREADVSLTDPDADRRHLQLHRSSAGIVATNVGASGTTVAGEVLIGSRGLGAADLLEVGGNLLAVVPSRAPDAALSSGPDLTVVLNRPPRLRPARTLTTVELPPPPVAIEPRRLAVLPLVLPLLLGGVLALVTHSPLFLLFALLSPAIALSGWWSDRRSNRSLKAKDGATHDQQLAAVHAERDRLAAAETGDRREACPDPAVLLLAATGPGRRVWERRRTDDDCLLLRVGTGTLAATSVRLTGTAEPTLLHDCPATVPLREVGVLGLAGPPSTTRALARWLVGQAAVLHGPRDLSIVLLSADTADRSWDWLRWLPHTAPTRGQDCTATVGTDPDTVALRVTELVGLVATRRAAREAPRHATPARPADVLVVLDGAHALRRAPGLASVLQDGPAVGVHVLCLDEQEGLLPEECRAVIACEAGAQITLRRDGEAQWEGVRGDLVSTSWAEQVARGLAPLRDGGGEQGESQIPAAARLLDVLDLQDPTPEAVRDRMGRSTEAVVGVGADGVFSVDLRSDGPHALIAGTTGSGKSELLQTLVASLAVVNRTDAMTFVLVDYKGGAAFKDCARLPHVVGMVTDLDGHLVERALASLTAELKAREALLAAAGAKDIEDLWATGATLARLVIVIDEFASLVEELPDFVRGLVGIAQRGRSLGVHLVLATQRPGGVVSPEIRANTNLRIALRVTDASESLDVIDAPDAAALSKTTPGRGYARTGHTSLTAFQSARIGGRRPGATVETTTLTAVPLPWSRVGQPLPPLQNETEPDEDQTDLHALVLAIQQACADDPLPRTPWLAALPTTVTLAEARRASPELLGLPAVVFGLEDLPAEQTTRAATLDLERGSHLIVAGAARSGRSTFLRTLGTSLAATVLPSDAHVYAIDCGNGSLLPLSDLPHVGAVVLRSQLERVDRLLGRLVTEVTRRQEVLAERGFADLAEQRAGSADPFPYLVLLLDRWEGFTAAFEDVDNGRLVDTVLRLLREGPGAGLRVVITGDRSVLIGKVATAVEDVLCLRLAERSDYSLAGLSPRLVPAQLEAGRALRGATGTEIQMALLVADDSGAAQAAAIGELVAHWRGRRIGGRLPFRVEALPTTVAAGSVAFDTGPLLVAVGVGGDDLSGQVVDLAVSGPGFTIAGPPRSGRSTALLGAALGLLAAGTELIVLAPRPSPLRDLGGSTGVLHLESTSPPDPDAVLAALDAARGPLVVVVDDAELLHTAAVGDLLQQVLRDGRDRGHGLVLAGTTDELASCFRGFTADARKSRTGLLLSPASHLEGELLGVRLTRSAAFTGPPGRGLLVRGGQALLVQVPHARPYPA
jgi:S-DNA-T family DNA segregation ATPase FtsK/SpoIIIE